MPADASIDILRNQELRQALMRLIPAAVTRIYATQFSATPIAPTTPAPYRTLVLTMVMAARRGLDCRIILAPPSPKNPQGAASQAFARDLAASGWRIAWAPFGHLLHSKAWIIDSDISIVGSHNLTAAAMMSNAEQSIIARSRSFATTMANNFALDWAGATQS